MSLFNRRRSAPSAAAASGFSLLDVNLAVTGDLQTMGSLRIEGRLEGSILKADSVVVGVGATISGDVHAREVILGGTLTGNIHASERVELQATAVVTGDVHTVSVLVQEGGVVNGRVIMSPPAPDAGRKSKFRISPELAER
ncbi:MAG TPA: polymer-forming cytoskeletal protein [Gemmatimonadaceae bacterium]|nr:polymer-forming cytoskeletal protein [Gemmatimonadaceae bacterium]